MLVSTKFTLNLGAEIEICITRGSQKKNQIAFVFISGAISWSFIIVSAYKEAFFQAPKTSAEKSGISVKGSSLSAN